VKWDCLEISKGRFSLFYMFRLALKSCGCGADSESEEQKGVFAKLLFLFVISALVFLAPQEIREIVRQAVSSAYIQVSTFVAATLALFYVLEHLFRLDTDYLLQKYENWHVPIAALMGALPGCGGAIVVMTQYVAGRLGFSSVVAVLCSTMGDAAFLLLAREPATALLVYAISLTAGVVLGYFVRFFHGKDYLRHEPKKVEVETPFSKICGMKSRMSIMLNPWLWMIVPGLALGIGGAFQIDIDLWFGPLSHLDPAMWFGLAGAFVCIIMWVLAPNAGPSITNLSGNVMGPHPYKCLVDRVATDTNFVTVWVITAFLAYELSVLWLEIDMEAFFHAWQPLLPLIAALIGFIPGCGPQIVVTTLYLNGTVPLSAQIANAISNDGDALFPAIALAPRAAVLATLYTAIPALAISYAWLFFME
jgi:hypothetical protein